MPSQNNSAPGDHESPEAEKSIPIQRSAHYQAHSPETTAALARITRKIDPAWLRQAQTALLAAIDMAGPKGATKADAMKLCPPARVLCWWCVVPRTLKKTIKRVASVPGPGPVTHGGLLRRWVRRE